MQVESVVCYWQWNGERWEMIRSFALDRGTHLADGTKWQGPDEWVRLRVPCGSDPEDFDWREIPGRTVTGWELAGGICLMELSPPASSPWLSPIFCEAIRKDAAWRTVLEGGFRMYQDTLQEVRKFLYELPAQGDGP